MLHHESASLAGVTGQVRVEDLERDFAAQLSILSAVNSGKSARPNGLQDVVAANSLSCHPFPRSTGLER